MNKRADILERHLDRLARHQQRLEAQSNRFVQLRLLAFFGVIGLFLLGLALGPQTGVGNTLGLIFALPALIVFGVLVYYNRQVNTTIERFALWRVIKRQHLARTRLDWAHIPATDAKSPEGHPFAVDLDIVGTYSLHRLLDTTVSKGGSRVLLDWLLQEKPYADETARRQMLIRDMIPLTNFRDRLTLNATLTAKSAGQKWDGEFLLRWLREKNDTVQVSAGMVGVLVGLSATTIVLFFLATVGVLPPLWIGTFTVYLLLATLQWRNLGTLFTDALRLQAQLERLGTVFNYLETYHYGDHDPLKTLCQPIITGAPSQQLRRLRWITSAASLQRNVFLWMAINLIVPWDIVFAYLLGRSKGRLAGTLPTWLQVWYELEAVSTFATFAHLNPAYTFPQMVGEPVLRGDALGHPLIPKDEKVTNDFTLDKLGNAIIITGSNMSGKSSFLRTLGVNLRLAYCGSVVDAATLDLGFFRLFTCIRVSDSVVDGFSYFYAEVRRLKQLLEALQEDDEAPLFFLIDEIFRGTNNRERLTGSRAYIQSLIGGHGMGLISTHDLELVNLAERIDAVQNVHFRDDIVDGKMTFDYKLRPGPSPTTNALKIMQLEGLPVPTSEEV